MERQLLVWQDVLDCEESQFVDFRVPSRERNRVDSEVWLARVVNEPSWTTFELTVYDIQL